jgi:ammonium transporter, Amt family
MEVHSGLVWMILDYRLERKWSMVGFCTGAITGFVTVSPCLQYFRLIVHLTSDSLVAITPAAGYVGTPAAALIGLVSSCVSNWATRLKVPMHVDDP